jgi:hypothetical protein
VAHARGHGFPSAALVRAAEKLRVDRWTAEVVDALRERGIRTILLKGPAVARWLYADDSAARAYRDVDLLVGPGDLAAAEKLLEELGFEEGWVPLGQEWEQHARPWRRPQDGALVDLHRTLHGMEELPPARVWRVAGERTETWAVGTSFVEVPNRAVRTLHAALHLDANDRPGTQAWGDLERAVERVDRLTWRRAAELASDLGIEAEMGERLRMQPMGRALADELGLATGGSERFRLRAAVGRHGAGPQLYSVHRLASRPGWRAKAGYLRQKLFPPPVFMRQWSQLAGRGGAWLVVAYLARAAWCVARLPRGVEDWLRFRWS